MPALQMLIEFQNQISEQPEEFQEELNETLQGTLITIRILRMAGKVDSACLLMNTFISAFPSSCPLIEMF